jgi:hypothetical protein
VSAVATDQRDDCYGRLVTGILTSVLEQGKPAARRGRKATGLSQEKVAGLPKGDCSWDHPILLTLGRRQLVLKVER